MNSKSIVAGLYFGVLAASLGCGRSEAQGIESAAAVSPLRSSLSSFAFSGAGVNATSRVERSTRVGGGEVLKGATEVISSTAPSRLVLGERAEIDATGRLVLATAELRSGSAQGDLVRSVELDAARGSVTVRDARGERVWSVPVDEPLVYRGLFTDVAPQASDTTAVQAWVARLGARSSSRVRTIDVAARESHTTPVSQVLFADGASVWVVLGDEAVETDDDFVRALPWKTLESASAERRAADLRCEPGPA